MRKRAKSTKWEAQNSSLAKISKQETTYEQCRKYACEDIVSKLTHIEKQEVPFIVEIPENEEFHFIGRVNTTQGGNISKIYYKTFEDRNFVGFSTINKDNISHYRGEIFFVYNIFPEDIVHIFPVDSDTKKHAKDEQDLTYLPSLWLNLQELEDITNKLKVYNQITCKTKRNGKIIKPFAVIAFDKMDENIQRTAKEFGIGIIIIHPDKEAINYTGDLLYDEVQFDTVSRKIEQIYGIDIKSILYMD